MWSFLQSKHKQIDQNGEPKVSRLTMIDMSKNADVSDMRGVALKRK